MSPNSLGNIPIRVTLDSILSISENPRVTRIEVFPRDFFIMSNFGVLKVAQDSKVGQFRTPKVAQIEVIPREYFDLSNFGIRVCSGIPKVAQNEEIPRDFFILSNFANPEVTLIEIFPRENSILSNFRILSFADFPTCTKDLTITCHSGFPRWPGLKTCAKDFTISGQSWNSWVELRGPSQLGNIFLLSLSLSPESLYRDSLRNLSQFPREYSNPSDSGLDSEHF